MQAAGWEIGSHTRTHPRLTRLGDEELLGELQASREECEDRLGVDCSSLAYPYGDYDERVALAATRAGFGAGACLPPGPTDSTALGWPRVGIYGPDGGLRFRLKVSRAMRWARHSPLGAQHHLPLRSDREGPGAPVELSAHARATITTGGRQESPKRG